MALPLWVELETVMLVTLVKFGLLPAAVASKVGAFNALPSSLQSMERRDLIKDGLRLLFKSLSNCFEALLPLADPFDRLFSSLVSDCLDAADLHKSPAASPPLDSCSSNLTKEAPVGGTTMKGVNLIFLLPGNEW